MSQKPIAIDGRGAIFYRGTGIGTYTWQLLTHLQANVPDLRIFLPGQEYADYTFSPTDAPAPADIWREEFLPKTLKNEKIGLYHVPQNGIGLPSSKCCKETVTIHDLIPYIYPETVGRGYLKEFLKEFSGFLQTDGYTGYNKVENIKRLYFLTHIRRKFHKIIVTLYYSIE